MNPNFKTLPTIVYMNANQLIQIIRAEITNDLKLAIDVINIGDRVIKKIKFGIFYKDENEEYLFNGTEYFYQASDVDIYPKTIYFIKPFEIDSRFNSARAVEVRIVEVSFDNGKTYTYDKKDESAYVLPIITVNKLKKVQSILGPEIRSYGENLMDSWRCVCSATNPKEVSECRYCGRNKNFILNNLTEPLINMKLLNVMSGSIEYNDEKPTIDSTLTQTQLSKVAPTTDFLDQVRVNEERPKENINNNSLFKKILKIIVTIILIVALGIISFVGFNVYKDVNSSNKFSKAKALLAKGEYEKALKELEEIKPNEKIEVDTYIQKAKALIESEEAFRRGNDYILDKKYIDAVKEFKKVDTEDTKNYTESQDKIAQLEDVILKNIKDVFDSGDRDKALDELNTYLSIVPESANAKKLKDAILNHRDDNDDYVSDSLEDAPENDKDRAAMIKKSEGLLNTYQKVLIEKANLRLEPSIDSEILAVLPADSDLYITDVKIEGTERIWCFVEAKNSQTGEILKGWISDKAMQK